ncbi:hypothetical protein WICPIJ_006180 [Wickerhamomyces pijperi]|uniref:Uncharacterized protein n=1 Tax=Wickerhamomyces pijperi TaxID=599730 RepID=A0A9P8Q2J1_WICPI|nr:hypothetical protein WICPIJ_006180 [Wickerhamomyces pijperi]
MSSQSQDSLSSGQTPYDPKQDSEYLTIDKERPLSTLNRSTVIPDLESASPDNFQDAKETPSSNLMGSFDQNTTSAAMDRQPIVTIFDVASDIEKMLQDLVCYCCI